jgi:hypothetical protein
MKLGLILTNDWELFGDGSGDYYDVQHKPLLEFLATIENHGAKITLMAEVFQQFIHKEFGEKDERSKEISIAWEEAAKETISRNHDIQLHLHPHWKNAEYKDGKWHLYMNYSRLNSLPEDEARTLLINGKNYLEDLLKPINPNYKCTSFRAGGYYLDPSDTSIKLLKEAGIICDTSVTKDFYSPGYYDFQDAYSNILPWHTTRNDINKTGEIGEGLLEFPIYSETKAESPAFKKLFPKLYFLFRKGIKLPEDEIHWQNEREHIKNLRYPKSQRFYKQLEKKNLSWYIRAIWSKNTVQLDYDNLHASVFVKMLQNIFKAKDIKQYLNQDIIIPVIALGHIKDAHNADNLNKILETINKELKDRIVYWTLREAVEYYSNK